MEINTYKLHSGEEIIGSVVRQDKTAVILNSVRVLVMQQVAQDQYRPVMIPWMISAQNGDVRIDRSIIVGEPTEVLDKALEDAFIKNTTGLDIVGGDSRLSV